jgi:hypothetical protein
MLDRLMGLRHRERSEAIQIRPIPLDRHVATLLAMTA